MSLAGVFGPDRWRGRRRQAGIGGLTDLDAAVGDELRDDETGGGGDDDDADRPRRRQYCTDPRRSAHRCVPEAPQKAFAPREETEEEHGQRSQPLCRRFPGSGHQQKRLAQPLDQHRTRLLDSFGEDAIGLASALGGAGQDRAEAPSRRCYHRASLRQFFRFTFFRSSFRRAREGLFHAPIPAFARSLAFVPTPFHN